MHLDQQEKRLHRSVALKHPKESSQSFQPISLHQTRWARPPLTKHLRGRGFAHVLQRRKPFSPSRAALP